MSSKNLSIKELLERYNLKIRKSIYDWCKKGAKIELQKDENGRTYATPEQVALLDQLAEHLKKPDSTLSNFVPVSTVEVNTPVNTPINTTINNSIYSDNTEINPQINTPINTQLLAELTSIGYSLVSALRERDPLEHYSSLERAMLSNWLLTTSEVKALIGVKPKTKKGDNTFRRGNWVFVKSGKIGNQAAWAIEKTISNKEVFNSDNSTAE